MAKPAGAITPGDGGYPAQTSPANAYALVSFPYPFAPYVWMTDSAANSRYKISVAQCHTIGAATNLVDSLRFINDELPGIPPEDTTAGAANAVWKVRDDVGPYAGITCTEPALGDEDTLPHRSVMWISWNKDAATTTEMLGVSIEHVHDDAYADTPITERNIDLIDRSTILTYAADFPASAWHAQWVLCHTLNRIEYCAPQCWSVPV